MAEQRQDDHLETTYSNSMPIQDIALKISQERWTIETGGERGSGRSVMAAWRDDDDDDAYNDELPIFSNKILFYHRLCIMTDP